MKINQAALFLDRDGVINTDRGYVYRREDVEFIDGIFDLVRRANSLNTLVIVVTNQSGIARGYYTENDFQILMDWMRSEFKRRGANIDDVYYCPFHPTQGIGKYRREHLNRKPNPGMLLEAAKDHSIDLDRSLLIGDRMTDIQAGLAANIGTLILLGSVIYESDPRIVVVQNLGAAQMILNQKRSPHISR